MKFLTYTLKEWYLGSKLVVVSEYLRRCSHQLSPNATVVVTDADVLVNARDRASLLAGLEAHAGRLARGEVSVKFATL